MTYYSALHYASKAEKSAKLAEQYATQATSFSGKVIQIGFDGFMENGQLVFKHSPAGIDIPYDLLDDYEYELDLAYFSTDSLPSSTKIVIRNGTDTINFVSALHRDSTTPVTFGEMNQVMRFNDATGYRWLFKAAFKITPAGQKVFLLYPVVALGGGGSGRNIGDIFYTSRLDTELNGAVEANGATYNVTDFRGEHSVPELLKAGKLPYVSLAEFAELVETNGVCRAFGYDGGYSFRVPKLNDVYLMAGTAATAGEFISESLPNIKGSFRGGNHISGTNESGAFYDQGARGDSKSYSASEGREFMEIAFGFDASRSSSTYQDGAKVRPDSVKYRAMVQLATGVKEDATQLKEYKFNNPHFFGQSMWTDVTPNNASWLLSNGAFHSGATYVDYYQWLLKIHNGTETVEGVSVKGVSDEYTDYDFVINTADTTFRLPLDTKLASGKAVKGNGMTLGWTNGTGNNGSLYVGNLNGLSAVGFSSNAYGSVLPLKTTGVVLDNASLGVTTDPTKSGIETASDGLKLYFYVGDTLQDPALINAGAVLSDIAELKGANFSQTAKETIVGWGMPDYTAAVDYTSNWGSVITTQKRGWLWVRGNAYAGSTPVYLTIGNVSFNVVENGATSSGTGSGAFFRIPPTQFQVTGGNGYTRQIIFFPCMGA